MTAAGTTSEHKPLDIIVFSTNSGRDGGETLADDLVREFARRGHRVQVVALDWARPSLKRPETVTDGNVTTLWLPVTQLSFAGQAVARASKWAISPWVAAWRARRALAGRRYDLAIGSSPATALAPLLHWATSGLARRTYFHSVDFFPQHQHSLGMLPGGLVLAALLRIETWLLRRFDVIACMSALNVRYLKANFKLRPDQQIAVLPLWGPIDIIDCNRHHVRQRFALPPNRTLVLFGGQIHEGRGIEEIIETARLAQLSDSPLHFVFAGHGNLVKLVEDYVSGGGTNVALLEPMPRDDYLALASACDIGLVATVPHVTVPTFPSKTIDYLRAGLPVAASVEASTDYSDFIEGHGFGRAVRAGNPADLLDLLMALHADAAGRATMVRNGATALMTIFAVEAAASRVLAQAGLAPCDDAPSLCPLATP